MKILSIIVTWLVMVNMAVPTAQADEQKYGKWQEAPAGDYQASTYTATVKVKVDVTIEVKQIIVYFHQPYDGSNPDRCNRYVYWYNPAKKTIWARCPTPNHPNYQKMVKNIGPDLWQVIPLNKRVVGESDVTKVSVNFDAVFSAQVERRPIVAEGSKTVIDCIDFSKLPKF